MQRLKIGMLLFPDVTLMDFAGPYDVFIRADCFEVIVVSEATKTICAEGGLSVQANVSFSECPQLDVLFVPGGRGINALLVNRNYLNFLKEQSQNAQYITSVCTGSLVLAAAGLLTGYKATTHWRSLPLLKLLAITTAEDRVVIDGNRITGGGVTSGIDFALTLTAIIAGDEQAQLIQLMLEYNPKPPFQSGIPQTASLEILAKAEQKTLALFEQRLKIIEDLNLH